MNPMFYTSLLLFVVLYLYAVFFRGFARDATATIEPSVTEMFPSVSEGIISCLMYGTLLDGPSDVFKAIWTDMGGLPACAFTVLNMLIGVLCEVVSGVGQNEKRKADIKYLQNNLLDVLEAYDKNDDNTIGPNEFDYFFANPEVHDALAKFGTDLKGITSLKKVLFESADALSFESILK